MNGLTPEIRCEANGNNVELMIYGSIGDNVWWDDVADRQIVAILNAHKNANITVRINSLGGLAHSGIAIYNALQQHPGKVTTVVEGLAASAASIVAMAGTTTMLPGSMLMAHNPWSCAAGDADDMRQAAEMLDTVRDALVEIYQKKTGKSADELKTLLKTNTWMTSKKAKELGFADVVESVDKSVAGKRVNNLLVMNSVEFPMDSLTGFPESEVDTPANIDPPKENEMTPEEFAAAHPEWVASIKAEAHAAGVQDERNRIKGIEANALPGHADLIQSAKFENPLTPDACAAAIIQAEKAKLQAIGNARIADAGVLNSVAPSAGTEGLTNDTEKRSKLMAAFKTGQGRK
jgi:ATP-dependent Clp protease protease subunit